MKRLFHLSRILIFSFACFDSEARAEAHSAAQIQAAKEFHLDAIHLWMKQADVAAVHPEAKPFPALDDARKDMAGLKIAKTPNTDGVELALWSGRVTMYRILLSPERVCAQGGPNGVLAHLTALFGKPDASSAAGCDWKLEDASFSCRLTFTPELTVITVADTGLLNEGIFSHAVKMP